MVGSGADADPGRDSPAVRAAAVMYLTLGAGFGVGTVLTLVYLAREGELPMTPFGFRSLSGPFEQLGQDVFMALGWALVGLCVLDVVAGVWLWQGHRKGAWLGLATTPLALVLGGGFALPFLLVGAPLRAWLVFAHRHGLR